MTKQVALSNRAYKRLRNVRLADESFSDTVERLIDEQAKDPHGFPKRVAGLSWRRSPAEQLRAIEADRDATREPA